MPRAALPDVTVRATWRVLRVRRMVDIDTALEALRGGELIGLPTDTVYGIAADPFDERAVDGLFRAKGRSGVKPIPILAAALDDLDSLVVIDDELRRAAARHWPGALTLIVERSEEAPDWIGDSVRGSIGVRLPDHALSRKLLRAAGPLAVTSANRSGERPAVDDAEARSALGDAVAVYLAGAAADTPSSTVVDLTGPRPRVLRAGPVSWGAA